MHMDLSALWEKLRPNLVLGEHEGTVQAITPERTP